MAGRSSQMKWTPRLALVGMVVGAIGSIYRMKSTVLMGYGWSDTYFWHLFSRDWDLLLFGFIMSSAIVAVMGVAVGLMIDWLCKRRVRTEQG